MPIKVLITGGTGFLGAYIIKNLIEKNYSVRAIRRSANIPFFIPQNIMQKVEWVEGDVLDTVALADAMQGAEAIIHSAAIVSFDKKNRNNMYAVNCEGTCNVVNVALENNISRFVHISSVAALGRTIKMDKINEERKWINNKNNTHYAISKHKAEMEVWRGFSEGLNGIILNPATILGYGDWHASSCAIFKNVYKEFSWYTEGVNGFVGVEDVAEITEQLLSSGITEKRFIVNSENWTFRQLINTIAEYFGKRKPHREATPMLGEIAWRMEYFKSLFTGENPLLTRESSRVAHSKTEFDNSLLLKTIPSFSFTPLNTVIKNACAKYEEAMKSGQLTL
ncbi:MAG TPA: NAD-dependent epimerase/dehydratase family protein [Chitinophagaceae bacterium]|nr:NAD-dependent epimerase/dehydratase family protein [Chitinophagaceae bacterium]